MAELPFPGLVLLHNPRCSKSRAAKELLEARGVAFELRLYLEDPLSREELAALRRRLGRPASEWVRRGEPAFAAAGLSSESDDERVLDALAAHPELLERPIVVCGERAVVGRPPEQVLTLLRAADAAAQSSSPISTSSRSPSITRPTPGQ